MIFVMVVMSGICLGQQEYKAVYTLPDNAKRRLKAFDTIRESYTFTTDSFKYAYAVMRPTVQNKIISADYVEYGKWYMGDEVTLVVVDTNNNKGSFMRQMVLIDDKEVGYFAPEWASHDRFILNGNKDTVFVKNKRVFMKTGVARSPLIR